MLSYQSNTFHFLCKVVIWDSDVMIEPSVHVFQHTTRWPRGRPRNVGLQQRHRDAFQNGVSGDTVQTISGHDEQESSPW